MLPICISIYNAFIYIIIYTSALSPSPKTVQSMIPPEVSWNGQRLKFYARFCGVKGDWPWLRTCYKLSTGFTSKRICHECPSNDPQLLLGLVENMHVFFS